MRHNSGDLAVATVSIWGGIFAICKILLMRSPFVSYTHVKFVQTLPQGSMIGIKRAQTHPINWTLNARVLLWLKRV